MKSLPKSYRATKTLAADTVGDRTAIFYFAAKWPVLYLWNNSVRLFVSEHKQYNNWHALLQTTNAKCTVTLQLNHSVALTWHCRWTDVGLYNVAYTWLDGSRIHRSPTENYMADLSIIYFGGVGLWLMVRFWDVLTLIFTLTLTLTTTQHLPHTNPNRYPKPKLTPNLSPY